MSYLPRNIYGLMHSQSSSFRSWTSFCPDRHFKVTCVFWCSLWKGYFPLLYRLKWNEKLEIRIFIKPAKIARWAILAGINFDQAGLIWEAKCSPHSAVPIRKLWNVTPNRIQRTVRLPCSHCPATVAQRQVGLGIQRSRVRNSLLSLGFFP